MLEATSRLTKASNSAGVSLQRLDPLRLDPVCTAGRRQRLLRLGMELARRSHAASSTARTGPASNCNRSPSRPASSVVGTSRQRRRARRRQPTASALSLPSRISGSAAEIPMQSKSMRPAITSVSASGPAFERHVRCIVAAGKPQPLRRPMGGAADTGRSVRELAALFFAAATRSCTVLKPRPGCTTVTFGMVPNGMTPEKIAHRIVDEVGIGRRRRRMRGRLDQERVPVGVRLYDGGGADRAAGAAAVLDHAGVCPSWRDSGSITMRPTMSSDEPAANGTMALICLCRIGLRSGEPRQCRRRKRGGGHGQECAARGHPLVSSSPEGLLFHSERGRHTAATRENMS